MIESTNECYSNANDEKTRSFEMLDPFRHEDYPDDVLVLIINHQYRKKEQIWVRLNKYIGKDDSIDAFTGVLLDEPFDDIYGMHYNDEILIGYITPEDGDPFLVGLPKSWKSKNCTAIIKENRKWKRQVARFAFFDTKL